MTSLPDWPEETALLRQLAARHWTLYAFGERRLPDAIAAVQRFTLVSNVVVIRGHDRVAAYRAATMTNNDPLRVGEVIWHYLGRARNTLRAVLDLRLDVHCGPPYPIPDDCRVPELARRPITIVLPGNGGQSPSKEQCDDHARRCHCGD